MRNRGSLLRFALLASFWGTSFLWIKIALPVFSPVQIVFARLALAALFLLGFCAVRGLRLPRDRGVWLRLIVATFFANALPFTLFAIGERSVDSGLAGVLNATTPLFALGIGLASGQDRNLGWTKVTGLLVGFLGTLLIFAPGQSGVTASWGALACLTAAASYGVGYAYVGKYLSGRPESPTSMATAQMIVATGWMVLALPFGGLAPIHVTAASWPALAAVGVLGLFGTGVAFMLNFRLITDEGGTMTASVGYLLPLVSVLVGTVFLGEHPGFWVLVGVAVVLAGVALSRYRPRPSTAPRTPTTARRATPTIDLESAPAAACAAEQG